MSYSWLTEVLLSGDLTVNLKWTMIPSSPTVSFTDRPEPKELVSVCHDVVRTDGGELPPSTTDGHEMATADTRRRVRQATLKAEVDMLAAERSNLIAENASLKAENEALCEALEQVVEDETNGDNS